MINPMELTGKLFVVTGASSGLGRQVCITLSELGAKVILISRNENKLKETLSMLQGDGHALYPFDVSNVEEIEALIKCIIDDNGKLDGFVHCAGIGTSKPLSLTKYDFMQEMMNIHVFSFIEFARVISKKKNCNTGASFVAISSGATIHSDKGKTAYSTTKGALDKAVRPLAFELGEAKKIRVNTVNPGWIKTDMYYEFIEKFGEDRMKELESTHFLGACEPYEVANLVAFLLSDASAKITGQNIVIDGGWTIH